MAETITQPNFGAIPLTKELASQHLEQLTALANQIPEVDYKPDDILADHKGERQLRNKWDHSLVVFEDNVPIAFVIGYERQVEGNEQYPENTLYISELAVVESRQQQGIARSLLTEFFEKNNEVGFLSLEGELNYSIQTNSAEWNEHVLELYKSFGFEKRATKNYPNRTDAVLRVTKNALKLD